MLGASPPQEQCEQPHITDEEVEEDEEPTPVVEKSAPIPPTSEEINGDATAAEVEEVQGEEDEEALGGTEDENEEGQVEDKVEDEEEEEEEEEEQKETERKENETEEPKSESRTEEEEVVQKDESKGQEAEEEEEDEDEDEEDEDEDDDTTAEILTESTSPIKPHNNKTNSAKTNGHVLLGSEGLKPNPGTPRPLSPTPEPLLCPLVESELSYTDRDNSLSSGYEMYNGELVEPGLTNGSSERHKGIMPLFPDLPLDPEPGSPICGTSDVGAGPSPNSPTADRSRTVSSSSTGDTPKGESWVDSVYCIYNL